MSELCASGPANLATVDQVLLAPFHYDGRPALVSHVSFSRKPPFTLIYHIRTQAHWSDGVPVTARNFVFTDHAIRTLLPPDSQVAMAHAYVQSIRALDSKTVRVVLKSRYSNWPYLFGGGLVCCAAVLPQHVLAGIDLRTIWRDPRTSGIQPLTGIPYERVLP